MGIKQVFDLVLPEASSDVNKSHDWKVDQREVEEVFNSLKSKTLQSVSPIDKLKIIISRFDSRSKIDFEKAEKAIHMGYDPLLTGSRSVENGYSHESDIDVVMSVKHSYCNLLGNGGINITSMEEEDLHREHQDKEYDDKHIGTISPISTFRFGPINLILVHPEAYEKWQLSTLVISSLKVTKKRDRVMIFQAIRHGKYVDIESNDAKVTSDSRVDSSASFRLANDYW